MKSAKKGLSAEGEAKRRFAEIPVDLIDRPGVALRQSVDEEQLEELRRSIRRMGILVPLLVKQVKGRYELIAGSRRLLCAAADGLATVPAIIVRDRREYELWAQLAENLLREAINPLDEAYYIAAVLEEMSCDQAQAAAVLGVSESWVSQRLGILRWPGDVKEAVRQGWLTFAAGRELQAIDSAKVRAACLKNARLYGCTARHAAIWRRDWQRSQGQRVLDDAQADVAEQPDSGSGELACLVCEEVRHSHEGLIGFVCTPCRQALEESKERQRLLHHF